MRTISYNRKPRQGERRGFAPLPTRVLSTLDPYLRMELDAANRLVSRSCFEGTRTSDLSTCASGHGG